MLECNGINLAKVSEIIFQLQDRNFTGIMQNPINLL